MSCAWVSAPATTMRRPSHSRSMHPSGSTRVSAPVARDVQTKPPGTRLGRSRYTPTVSHRRAASGAGGEVRGDGCRGRRLAVEGLEDDLGDVRDHDLLVLALALHAVVHHHVAEGAGDGDPLRTGGDGLLSPLGVDLLADRLLHPHPRATGAAAHAPGA